MSDRSAAHELLSIDPNSIPAQICANAAGCTSGGTPGTVTKAPSRKARSTSRSRSSAQPYLSGGILLVHRRQQQLQRSASGRDPPHEQGLQFRGNYTWSKNLDMNSGLTIAQANNQPQMVLDRNDLRRDWGPSALNIASQASISASYELPFGNGQAWLNDAAAWKANSSPAGS